MLGSLPASIKINIVHYIECLLSLGLQGLVENHDVFYNFAYVTIHLKISTATSLSKEAEAGDA